MAASIALASDRQDEEHSHNRRCTRLPCLCRALGPMNRAATSRAPYGLSRDAIIDYLGSNINYCALDWTAAGTDSDKIRCKKESVAGC